MRLLAESWPRKAPQTGRMRNIRNRAGKGETILETTVEAGKEREPERALTGRKRDLTRVNAGGSVAHPHDGTQFHPETNALRLVAVALRAQPHVEA
jgi:hypothetical protein